MKRRGAIAAILAFFAPICEWKMDAQGNGMFQPVAAFQVTLPERPDPGMLTDCQAINPNDPLSSVVQCKQPEPYHWCLEVRYKNRVVRFRADELMDILEGKEPKQ